MLPEDPPIMWHVGGFGDQSYKQRGWRHDNCQQKNLAVGCCSLGRVGVTIGRGFVLNVGERRIPYLSLALRSSLSTVFPNPKWHSYIFDQLGPNTAELDKHISRSHPKQTQVRARMKERPQVIPAQWPLSPELPLLQKKGYAIANSRSQK